MKEILIDLSKTKELYSGLGQFSKNFGKEILSRQLEGFVINFLVPRKNKILFRSKYVNLIETSFVKRYLPSINRTYTIWHSLDQFPSFLPNKNTTWILTIHDLNFMVEKNEVKRKKYLKNLQRNVDHADYITTISRFTKQEIEKHLNLGQKEVHIIYNGVLSGKGIKKVKPSFLNDEKYFFSIGIFNKKKNFKVLLPLMKHFPHHKLVIAGKKDTKYGMEIEREIMKLNLADRIILPGKINASNKQWLYANCEALLFPSLAEGFGLPVIEAMYEGKPVFLSKSASLPEIGGKLAFYFENFNDQQMSSLIRSRMDYVDKNKRYFLTELKKHANKFNWENCMTEYLNLYREIEITTHNK